MKKDGILLIPIVLLIMLLILQFSPFFAGFWSIVASIVVSTFKQKCWYLLGVQAAVFVASILYGGDAVYLMC